MSIFPTSRESRWSLVFTALSAYIIGVPLVGMCSRLLAVSLGWDDLGSASYGAQTVLQSEEARRYTLLGFGHIICLLALFLFLPAFREKCLRRVALGILILGFVFLVIFIYPMTQIVRMR